MSDWPDARPPGSLELVYRYTVVGSDKASIDTGADAADAGSTDWTNGDLLEVFIYARLDEAVTSGQVNITLNGDSAAHYDRIRLQAANTTVSGAGSITQSNWFFTPPGANATASVFGSAHIVIPNYAGTVGFKVGTMLAGAPDETAANQIIAAFAMNFRSTAAISRVAIAPNTSGKKLIIGSQLLVYKRLAA